MPTIADICFDLPPTAASHAKHKAFPPELPRIARLMALAIHLNRIAARPDTDWRDIARRGRISRTRLTQILNLLHLAPDIQERLLFLECPKKGRVAISEKKVRPLASEYDWACQRLAFAGLLEKGGGRAAETGFS